jgi:hypothetical protein
MKLIKNLIQVFLFLILFSSCGEKELKLFHAQMLDYKYSGRIEIQPESTVNFITSASGIEIIFTGDTCSLMLKNASSDTPYNFVSIELDGEYLGRIKVANDSIRAYPIRVKNEAEQHRLLIVKSTEASNGAINFGGIYCESLLPVESKKTVKIEFIGNSITCAMGADTSEIPCGTNQWFDQHNAYFSYGRMVANNLNADFVLSSVSGIGIYRTWNDEGLNMPMVYQNSYLNLDSTNKWDFTKFVPDIVSIALGTNDLSDGDGLKPRIDFNQNTFSNAYIEFLNIIYSKYPNTKIALLTSPMVTGAKDSILNLCLQKVKSHFNNKKIEIFRFSGITPHGCSYHPSKEEHQKMADTLTPFFKKLLESK